MSSTKQPSSHFNAITLALFIGPIIYLSRKQKRLAADRQKYKEEREAEVAFLTSQNNSSQPLRPPLPDILRRVLSRCRFAYLSTVDAACNSSHLSLMRFTYLPEEETIIMSTNRRTKKYDMLEKQSGVALLIHNFEEVAEHHTASDGDDEEAESSAAPKKLTGEFSITLNGNCSVVKDGKFICMISFIDVRYA